MQMKIPGIKFHSFATTFIFLHTYANQSKVSILLPVPLGDLKINDLCLDVYCTLWTLYEAITLGRLLAQNDLIPFLKHYSCFFFSSIYFFKCNYGQHSNNI